MPRKLRVAKKRIEGISETQMYLMADGLYERPDDYNEWEELIEPGLKYPTADYHGSENAWQKAAEQIMEDWLRERPGTRPAFWWHFTAPRMTAAQLEENGWEDCWFADHLCIPRLRLGGIGTPRYEVLAYVPHFCCGIPDSWITAADLKTYPDLEAEAIDPADPPRFESQGTYLQRLNLLVPGERRRLKAKDFEPEVITTAAEAAERTSR